MKIIEISLCTALILLGIYIDFNSPTGMSWSTLPILAGAYIAGWVVHKNSVAFDHSSRLTEKIERVIWGKFPHMEVWRGYQIQYLQRVWSPADAPETIMFVAIKHANGLIYSIGKPGRHHDVMDIMTEYEHGNDPDEPSVDAFEDQGFVTSRGRYVSRYEGASIARRNNQLIREPTPYDELTSEDLFHGGVHVSK
jgi:hypothetical protein